MFLNPKRKKSKGRSRRRNPLGRPGNTTSRSKYPPTQTTMARKHRKKHRKTRRTTARRSTARRTAARRTAARRTARRTARRSTRRTGAYKLRVARTKNAVLISNPRRRHRRHARRNPMGGNLVSQFKGVFSKDNLTVAAGAIAGTVVTQQVVARFGHNLPLINSTNETTKKVGVLTYDLGLPLLGAYLVRKQSPNLAKGMVIAALVNAINDSLKMFARDAYTSLYSPVASAGAYLNYQNVPNVLPVGGISSNRAPGYSGMNALATVRPTNGALDNSRAFPADAWN